MAFFVQEKEALGGKWLIFGTEGSGKTNLGKRFPLPIIIRTEKGVNEKGGMYSDPSCYEELVSDLKDLYNSDDMYGRKTLVVDSVSRVEPMINDYFCRQKSIAEVQDLGGKKMGGAYVWREAVLPIWEKLLKMLSAIHEKFECNIVIIAHNAMKQEKLFNADSYNKEDLDLINPKATSMIRRWSDVNAFIHPLVMVRNTTGNEKMKNNIGAGDGTLQIGLRRKGGYHAKCRDFDGRVDTQNVDVIPYEFDGASFFNVFNSVLAK